MGVSFGWTGFGRSGAIEDGSNAVLRIWRQIVAERNQLAARIPCYTPKQKKRRFSEEKRRFFDRDT
jgi:hypothetical protein